MSNMDLRYVRNKSTGKVHRVVVMLDNNQILSGEQCNLDQVSLRESVSSVLDFERTEACKHCFG